MKTNALVLLFVLLLTAVTFAGETAVTFNGGNLWLLDPGNPAVTLPGLGAGISYRPTYVNDAGNEVTSDLLFHASITPAVEQPYGSVLVDYRFAAWQGIDWLAGPGVAMLQESGGVYSLGAVGELRLEFNVGQNPMFFVIGAGYIWREATQEVSDPANVPFYLALGARTQ